MSQGVQTTKIHKAFGKIVDYKLSNGIGARFGADDGFIGFLGR